MRGRMILGCLCLLLLIGPVHCFAEALSETPDPAVRASAVGQPANAAAIEARTAALGQMAPRMGVENQLPGIAAQPDEQELADADTDEAENEYQPDSERLAPTGGWVADTLSDMQTDTESENAPTQALILPISRAKSRPWQLMVIPATLLLLLCLMRLYRKLNEGNGDPDRLVGPMGKRVKVVCGKSTEAVMRRLSTRLLSRNPKAKP